MKTLQLQVAAAEIYQACQDAHDQNQGPPFLVLVGAGVSYPPVPLAEEITRQCREKAVGLGRSSQPRSSGPAQAYSHWLATAYPQPIQRRNYLKSLIDGKNISQANFRLAHLLLAEDPQKPSLANIVATVNFDDHLSRVLRLFGKSHCVCDHPATSLRVTGSDPEALEVVHLHGAYEHYDLSNLDEEIARAASPSTITANTMAGLLDTLFRERSPLVVGYSGWTGDVVMGALARRLLGQRLPYNLYWFCYRRQDAEDLPDWLRKHPDARLVLPQLPEQAAAVRAAGGSTSPQEATSQLTAVGERSDEPLLPARAVFEELIRTFDLSTPRLTREPLDFFATQLEALLPTEDLAAEKGDLYSLSSVVAQLRQAAVGGGTAVLPAVTAASKDRLEEIRVAFRRAEYRKAIEIAREIDLDQFPGDSRTELLALLLSAAIALHDKSSDVLAAYDLITAIGAREIPASHHGIVAEALVNKGVVLDHTGEADSALQAFNEVIDRFRNSTDIDLQRQVARALVNKGVLISESARFAHAIQIYDEVIERFAGSTDSSLQEHVARAFINKGIALGETGQYKEAIGTSDDLIELFGGSTDPALIDNVASALHNKGLALHRSGHLEPAIHTYDEVIERFGASADPIPREAVARSLLNKGVALQSNGQLEQAVQSYEQLVERFSDASEPALRRQVAEAFTKEAPVLIVLAKQRLIVGAKDEAQRLLGRALEAGREAGTRISFHPSGLAHVAYARFLGGARDEAEELVQRAIKAGGETIREEMLESAKRVRLPEDEIWETIVGRAARPAVSD